MKRIDSCNLCLARARSPVACGKGGHLYCRECVLGSLLSQKSLLRTHQASLAALEVQEAEEKEQVRREARARVLSDFQKGSGLSGSASGLISGTGKTGTNGKSSSGPAPSLDSSGSRGVKRKATDDLTAPQPAGRKFTFDPSQVESLALAAEEAAITMIEAEQLAARKAKLPSFWLPSLTPESEDGKGGGPGQITPGGSGMLLGLGSGEAGSKIGTVCNIGEVVHPMTMKSLIPAIFTYASSSITSSSEHPSCPSCSREITNSVRTVLLTSKTVAPTTSDAASKKTKKDKGREKDGEKDASICGHVVCGTCADTIVKPGKQCVVCEAIVRPEKDMIELAREGTGFAAAGGAEVTKAGIAFQ